MSTQLSGDLKSTAPTRVSRNAVNPFGAKDLTALAATLSPVGRGAREARIATAPYRQSEFHEDLAEYARAAPLATDDINAAIAAGQFNAPASALKAAELRSRTAPRGKPRTREGCQNDLASVEGLTVALRRARDRTETASRARRPLLAGAHRDLRDNQQLTHSSMRCADCRATRNCIRICFRQHERNTKQDAAKQRGKHCECNDPKVQMCLLQVGYALRRECLKDAQKHAGDEAAQPLFPSHQKRRRRKVCRGSRSVGGAPNLGVAFALEGPLLSVTAIASASIADFCHAAIVSAVGGRAK